MHNEENPQSSVAKTEVTTAVSWEASEYLHHDKDYVWTLLLVAITSFLAALTYFLIEDMFSILVIILMAVAIGIFGHRKPRTLTYQIGQAGVVVSGKVYEYDKFKSFSIIDEGAIKSIMLEPIKRFMPTMSIYYAQADEDRISEVLSSYLPYREKQLEPIDRLFKKLRF